MRIKFLQKKYYKVAINSFLIAAFAYLLKNITNILLARNLSMGLYGDFTIGVKTFAIISTLLLLGSGNAAEKFLPDYIYTHDSHSAKGYVSWNFKLIFFSNLIFIVFLLLFITLLLILHLFNIKSLMSYHLTIYLLFLVPFGSFVLLLSQYLLSNRNVYWYNFLHNAAKYILYLHMLLPAIYFLNIVLTQVSLLSIMFIVFFVLAIFEYILTAKKLPYFISFSNNKLRNVKNNNLQWKRTSFKFIINSVVFYSSRYRIFIL